ncbi:MAG: GNAT family N-acetyltransferase [Bacteroidota bacterium]|nr:GNAT family N-acetyltransferase [Bacteroidota bacterium]
MILTDQFVFRAILRETDPEAIGELVRSAGFFYQEEIEIAVQLARERIMKGENSGYFFLLADIGNELAGYACFGPVPGAKDTWDLYWVAVHDHFRGKGLGSIILDKSIGIMSHSGARQVYAETSSREMYHATHQFYEKNEFLIVARLKDFYDLGDDKLIYMRKFMKGLVFD